MTQPTAREPGDAAMTSIPGGSRGSVPAFVAMPLRAGPSPGVVVIHDALGMTEDLRNQARWLADAGYLAAAPDLFHWGGRIRCLVRLMRDLGRGTQGPAFDDIAAVRAWLARHPRGSGRVGIIGFCMGGGFALMLAPGREYSASAVNYGTVTDQAWDRLEQACPIVASYGERDPSLKGAAARLEHVLAARGIPHDVKEYAGVGHSFMNDHDPKDMPLMFTLLARVSRSRYDAAAAADARQRIVAFFDAHLRGPTGGPSPEHG